MPQCCVVPLCSNRKSGHRFPREPSLLKKWLIAIRRDKFIPTLNSRVCNDHFLDSDYEMPSFSIREHPKLQLKKGCVPSQFSWTMQPTANNVHRAARAKRRQLRSVSVSATSTESPHGENNENHKFSPIPSHSIVDLEFSPIEMEVECDKKDAANQCFVDTCDVTTNTVSGVSSKLCSFGIENLKEKDKEAELHFYTGFESYDHFMLVFSFLGEGVNHLNYYNTIPGSSALRCLSPVNEFFLTMIKLRRGMPNIELSFKFNISSSLVGNVLITWINFLYCQFKELKIWPSHADVVDNMRFRGVQCNSTVIIDCTEMKSIKPGNPTAQQQTYSSYKGCNTVKILISISPTGAITFVSDGYGGSSSDREIFEECGMADLLEDKEVILADRGFHVQDLLAHRDIRVNTPAFLKKNATQLEPHELVASKQVSSKSM